MCSRVKYEDNRNQESLFLGNYNKNLNVLKPITLPRYNDLLRKIGYFWQDEILSNYSYHFNLSDNAEFLQEGFVYRQ